MLRQMALFGGKILLAGLPADDLLGRLPAASGWSWHAGEQQQLVSRFGDERCRFATEAPEAPFEAGVLFLPKSRELAEFLLQSLAARLDGGLLYLVGEKRAGIERAAKHLALYGKPSKLDSARHCQLWQVRIERPPQVPALTNVARRFTLELADGPLHIVSLPGVFSHGRLDAGSALLLGQLDDLPEGRLLDFGCGAGIIGCALKRRYPHSELLLQDVDAFALESSRLTLAANGLHGQLIGADGIDAAPKELAAIISNPPFHQGVHTDYRATERLLTQATQHLRPRGELRLVANTFLQYPSLIEAHVGPCTVLDEGQGFRVYRAKRS
nr:class I SAM-dependent methyltransferase [Azomonas macrocytogenes]